MNKTKHLGWVMLAIVFGGNQAFTAAAPQTRPDTSYGVRILGARPMQDFREALPRTGLGAGVFAETDLGSGTIAQTRFDYIRYPQTNQPNAQGLPNLPAPAPALSLLADSAALGVDIRHALPIPGLEGLYALAGAMGIRYEYDTAYAGNQVDQNGIPIPGVFRAKGKTSIKIGLAVGLGVELGRGLAMTERFTTININGFTFATLETGLSYRF